MGSRPDANSVRRGKRYVYRRRHVEGKRLPAGTYGRHAIPDMDEWTTIRPRGSVASCAAVHLQAASEIRNSIQRVVHAGPPAPSTRTKSSRKTSIEPFAV